MKTKVTGKEAASGETDQLTAESKPSGSALPLGKASVLVDGNEHVFDLEHPEFPTVLADVGRLSLLAKAAVAQEIKIEEEREKKTKIYNDILLELKNEGRTGFAYRQGPTTHEFTIESKMEKLTHKKHK